MKSDPADAEVTPIAISISIDQKQDVYY